MSILQPRNHFIEEHQILVIILAFVFGFLSPESFEPIAHYLTPLLMAVFFTSSLRINPSEMLVYVKDFKLLSIVNFLKLIVMPLALWLPVSYFSSEWALAFLIVGAVPTSITVALIADLFGGSVSFSMLISVLTSLLSTFTIPLVLQLTVGQKIDLPIITLFSSLFATMILPYLAAMVVKHFAKKSIEKYDVFWHQFSILLFGVLITGMVADAAHGGNLNIHLQDLSVIAVMLVYMTLFAWLAYTLTSWRTFSERTTSALCILYMNNTVALYVSSRFFEAQHITGKTLLILASVNILLPPMKYIAFRFNKSTYAGKTVMVKK